MVEVNIIRERGGFGEGRARGGSLGLPTGQRGQKRCELFVRPGAFDEDCRSASLGDAILRLRAAKTPGASWPWHRHCTSSEFSIPLRIRAEDRQNSSGREECVLADDKSKQEGLIPAHSSSIPPRGIGIDHLPRTHQPNLPENGTVAVLARCTLRSTSCQAKASVKRAQTTLADTRDGRFMHIILCSGRRGCRHLERVAPMQANQEAGSVFPMSCGLSSCSGSDDRHPGRSRQ